jgi:hypothetical protein
MLGEKLIAEEENVVSKKKGNAKRKRKKVIKKGRTNINDVEDSD